MRTLLLLLFIGCGTVWSQQYPPAYASSWSMWSPWSFCSNNIMVRVRACSTVRGFKCVGHNKEFQSCDSGVHHNKDGIDYDHEDSEDRKMAMHQLYEDYEPPVVEKAATKTRYRPAKPTTPKPHQPIAQYGQRYAAPGTDNLIIAPPGTHHAVEVNHGHENRGNDVTQNGRSHGHNDVTTPDGRRSGHDDVRTQQERRGGEAVTTPGATTPVEPSEKARHHTQTSTHLTKERHRTRPNEHHEEKNTILGRITTTTSHLPPAQVEKPSEEQGHSQHAPSSEHSPDRHEKVNHSTPEGSHDDAKSHDDVTTKSSVHSETHDVTNDSRHAAKTHQISADSGHAARGGDLNTDPGHSAKTDDVINHPNHHEHDDVMKHSGHHAKNGTVIKHSRHHAENGDVTSDPRQVAKTDHVINHSGHHAKKVDHHHRATTTVPSPSPMEKSSEVGRSPNNDENDVTSNSVAHDVRSFQPTNPLKMDDGSPHNEKGEKQKNKMIDQNVVKTLLERLMTSPHVTTGAPKEQRQETHIFATPSSKGRGGLFKAVMRPSSTVTSEQQEHPRPKATAPKPTTVVSEESPFAYDDSSEVPSGHASLQEEFIVTDDVGAGEFDASRKIVGTTSGHVKKVESDSGHVKNVKVSSHHSQNVENNSNHVKNVEELMNRLRQEQKSAISTVNTRMFPELTEENVTTESSTTTTSKPAHRHRHRHRHRHHGKGRMGKQSRAQRLNKINARARVRMISVMENRRRHEQSKPEIEKTTPAPLESSAEVQQKLSMHNHHSGEVGVGDVGDEMQRLSEVEQKVIEETKMLEKRISELQKKVHMARTSKEQTEDAVVGDTARALSWLIANMTSLTDDEIPMTVTDRIDLQKVKEQTESDHEKVPRASFTIQKDIGLPMVSVDGNSNVPETKFLRRKTEVIWSEWSLWSECNCGRQMRKRVCLAHEKRSSKDFKPRKCPQPQYEERSCKSFRCRH